MDARDTAGNSTRPSRTFVMIALRKENARAQTRPAPHMVTYTAKNAVAAAVTAKRSTAGSR